MNMNFEYPSVFVANTSNLNLGNLEYRLEFTKVSSNVSKVRNARKISDEFGDIHFDASIEVQDIATPKTLYFIRSKKECGFGLWDSIGKGSKFFFSDSWLWLPKNESFTSFEQIANELEAPSLFPGCVFDGWKDHETDPIQMLIHSPYGELVEGMKNLTAHKLKTLNNFQKFVSQPNQLNEIEKLQLIIDLSQYCEFITLWRHGPFRPVLFSQKYENALETISLNCEMDNIKFFHGGSEDDIPRW